MMHGQKNFKLFVRAVLVWNQVTDFKTGTPACVVGRHWGPQRSIL